MRFSQDRIDVETRGLRQSIRNIPGYKTYLPLFFLRPPIMRRAERVSINGNAKLRMRLILCGVQVLLRVYETNETGFFSNAFMKLNETLTQCVGPRST